MQFILDLIVYDYFNVKIGSTKVQHCGSHFEFAMKCLLCIQINNEKLSGSNIQNGHHASGKGMSFIFISYFEV